MPEYLEWPQMNSLLQSEIMEYRKIGSGIHMGLLASTRDGKTTLAIGGKTGNGILSNFEDCLVLDTTGDPGPIKDYGKPLSKYGSIRGHRRLSVSSFNSQSREKVIKAIQRARRQKKIAIYTDEMRQMADMRNRYFGLQGLYDEIWMFDAKHGISLIGGTQAPRWISSAFYDQVKASFIFRMRDIRTRKRLMEIAGGFDSSELVNLLPKLEKYQFTYIGMDGDLYVSKFDPNYRKISPKESNRNIRIIRA